MHDIDLDEYNWKQAATQESVDYQAVESTFMTQAYGFVANKAKVLFRDPFRLGFEIVHRNEKATKMVGIFAFRFNNVPNYVPVFFVNGEVKGADMLYRTDVKRFVPLTDEWCSFLVRGANEDPGTLQPRDGRRRQPDSNMYRLAYPQRVKYASADESIFNTLLAHCAQDAAPPALLVPAAIRDGGPNFLTKLAGLIENSEMASRFVAETYTKDDLTLDPEWCVKKAAENTPSEVDRYKGAVVLVRELEFAKSAADRKAMTERGYAMEDYRELGAINTVTDTIDDACIREISMPGVASVLSAEGSPYPAALFLPVADWLSGHQTHNYLSGYPDYNNDDNKHRHVVALSGKPADYTDYSGRRDAKILGSLSENTSLLDSYLVKPTSAKVGKVYLLVNTTTMQASDPFVVTGKDGKLIHTANKYGSPLADLIYKPDADRCDPVRGYINKDFSIIELKVGEPPDDEPVNFKFDTVWSKSFMQPAELDNWLRTGGGMTHSKDITVTKEPSGLFSVSATGSDGFRKVARSMDRMHAHVSLVGDYAMCVNKSGEILDEVEKSGSHRFRLFDVVTKSGYVTRMRPEHEWITGFDPILNAAVTMPQQQTLSTFTPERPQQHHRIGDRYVGEAPMATYDENEDGLPGDAIMTMSPEQLAEMANKYDMPHIFDHQVIGSLAANTYDTLEQVKQYIPDLETGVDRYARILFLLRYRPADFEEAYGKDDLMEMEQELSSLFAMAGKSLLRMLKRFDTDKFSRQSDS